MLAPTVTCPTCNTALKLKGALPTGMTNATCPKCSGPVPLPPATISGDAERTSSHPPHLSQETRARVTAVGNGPRPVQDSLSTPSAEFPFLAPPEQPDEIGRLGPYRVLAPIGVGGMGAVFRAEDPHLKRLVALKVMLPQYAGNALAKTRFLREARAQAQVEHDHVAAIHQVGEDAGVPFLAMPLLKGQPLGDALKANPHVPVAEAVRNVREMAEGLAAAHERKLIHRDIKPANVWLEGSRRRVKILDFGLARVGDADAGDAVTQQGAVIGTPAYMSPEQARGEALDPRSDLFSLGVVLYEMLAGRRPFRAGSATGLLIAVATENPPPPAVENPDVPPALDALTMRLLAKHPDDRPATAEAAAEELREVEDHLGTTGIVAVPVVVRLPNAPPDPWDAIDATDADPASVVRPLTGREDERPRSRTKLFVALGVLALLPLVVWLAVVVLRVETANGTLVVEIDDRDVEARIKNGKLVLVGPDGKERYTLTANDRNKAIAAGPYTIRVEGADGLTLDTTEFTLNKGDRVTVRVKLDPKVVAVKKKDPPVAIDPDRKAAEYVLSIGGTIRVNDEERVINALADLPRVPFQLTGVDLRFNKLIDDVGLLEFKDCRNLTYLDLATAQVGDAGLAAFKNCKNLTYLELGGSRVTDRGLAHFGDCKHLRHLALYRTQIGDAGLIHFKDCESLTGLWLDNTKITDAGLATFKNCKNLTTLVLTATQVTDAGLSNFQGCKSLRELELALLPRVTDAGVAHFKDCKNLMHVGFHETRVGDEGVAHFKDCKNLAHFWLRETQVSDIGLAHLMDKNLTHTSLQNTKVTDAGIDKLKKAMPRCSINWNGGLIEPSVKIDPDFVAAKYVLSIGGTVRVNDEERDIQVLADLPRGVFRLTSVVMRQNRHVNDAGLAHFKDCTKLTGLQLQGTGVTDAGLLSFKDCSGLTFLILGDTQVTDEGVAIFAGCKRMDTLNLANTRVTDKGLAVFKDCKKLTSLWLYGTAVTDAGLAHFKDCVELAELNLSNTQVGDAGIAPFKDCKKLTALKLRQTKITAAKVTELKKALPNCKVEW